MDVDAACGPVENEDARLLAHGARDQEFLLVASGQRAGGLCQVGDLDVVLRHESANEVVFLTGLPSEVVAVLGGDGGQGQVPQHRLQQGEALTTPIGGHEAYARLEGSADRGRNPRTLDPHSARRRPQHAGYASGDLGLLLGLAHQRDHLTPTQLQVERFGQCRKRQPAQLQQGAVGRGRVPAPVAADRRVTDHQPRELLGRSRAGVGLADDAAVPEHEQAIAPAQQLDAAMRGEDDAHVPA